MYARARRGEISSFTGIDDPYEPPINPEIRLETVHISIEENVGRIMTYLIKRGFL
jgi:adenylylsulfate kinase-like enzyme